MAIQPIHHSKKRGFTLVEVIVVAVIVAILAGVSVPLYLGYINNSRTNQATNAAGSAASFVNACNNGGNTPLAGPNIAGLAALAAGDIVGVGGAGTGGGVLSCSDGNAATVDPSLTAPGDIILTLNAGLTAFTARHAAGGPASAPFSFAN